jgi:hypothetical protein
MKVLEMSPTGQIMLNLNYDLGTGYKAQVYMDVLEGLIKPWTESRKMLI